MADLTSSVFPGLPGGTEDFSDDEEGLCIIDSPSNVSKRGSWSTVSGSPSNLDPVLTDFLNILELSCQY